MRSPNVHSAAYSSHVQGQKALTGGSALEAPESPTPSDSNVRTAGGLGARAPATDSLPKQEDGPRDPSLKRKAEWPVPQDIKTASNASGPNPASLSGMVHISVPSSATSNDLERVRAALAAAQRQTLFAPSETSLGNLQQGLARTGSLPHQALPLTDTQLILKATNLAAAVGLPLRTPDDLRMALQLLAAAESMGRSNQRQEAPTNLNAPLLTALSAGSAVTQSMGDAQGGRQLLTNLGVQPQQIQQLQPLLASMTNEQLAALAASHGLQVPSSSSANQGTLASNGAPTANSGRTLSSLPSLPLQAKVQKLPSGKFEQEAVIPSSWRVEAPVRQTPKFDLELNLAPPSAP